MREVFMIKDKLMGMSTTLEKVKFLEALKNFIKNY